MNLQTKEFSTPNAAAKPKLDIATLIDTNLPPSPRNILRVSTLLRDINTPLRKITEAVTYEPLLFTRVLRLANSPVYAVERKITSISVAINTIGNKALQEIVMVGLAAATFSGDIGGSVIAGKIWEHSLAVAIIPRELSEMLKMQGTEEAFTCGLLHDLGKLILLNHDFQSFLKISAVTDEDEMLECERQQFGYDHSEIGALVARRWGLQDEVSNAIRYHHKPSQLPYPMQVSHVVEVADIIANINGYGLRAEDESKLMQSDSTAKLKFTEEELEKVWGKVEKNIADIIKTFYN